MSSDRTRRAGAPTRGRPNYSTLARVLVVLVTAMLVTSSSAAALTLATPTGSPDTGSIDEAPGIDDLTVERADSATQTNAVTTTASNAVDVVFVMDRSDSMNSERYQLANEMRTFQRSLLERNVDARFGLVTYTTSATVAQPLTSDFDAIERAMIFSPSGSTERASDAILKATEMDYRSNAERVIVLVTDEDDDSTAEARAAALNRLSDGYTFLAISPSTTAASSCDVHSPPCDSSNDNELRLYADDVGGDWLDIETDSEQTMKRVARNVYDAVDASDSSSGSDSTTQFEVGPNIQTIDRSVNRTEIEAGESVAFNVTVRNSGLVEGKYNAFLTSNGELLAEKSFTVSRFSERTETLVYRFEEPGEYLMVLTHDRVDVVSVRDPDPMRIELSTSDAKDRLNARVTDASAGSPVVVDLPKTALLAGTGNELTSVTLTSRAGVVNPRHDLAFDLTLERIDGPPAGTPAVDTDARAVRYLDVTSSLPKSALRSVVFEYAKTSDDVTMYRYDTASGEWQALEQRPVDGAPGHVVASTTRLSTFALVVQDPPLSVESVDVGSTTVRAGDLVTGTVTVTNNGTVAQSYDATVSLDGDVVETEFVEVPAGGSVDVPISFVAETPGTYDLAVAGADQGTLQVDPAPAQTTEQSTTAATTSAPTTEQSTSASETTEPSDSTPGFSVVVALVALIAAALIVARRR